MAPEIEKQICEAFIANATTTELATKYGVTYQAIHRILKKNNLGRKNGGKSKEVAERNASAAPKVSPMQDRHGCTPEQWDELRAMDEDYKKTPLAAYNTFKNNFQNINKDAGFSLTLWEWWTLWKDSGRFAQRMRNPEGVWTMAQIDSAKPLCKENARIMPLGDLLKEKRKAKSKAVIVEATHEKETT